MLRRKISVALLFMAMLCLSGCGGEVTSGNEVFHTGEENTVAEKQDTSEEFDGMVVTAEQIEEYGIQSTARWGNLALGISYLLPQIEVEGESYVSLHGHRFPSFKNGQSFYIERVLGEHTDLYTLPLAINEERNVWEQSHYDYNWLGGTVGASQIQKTEKRKINGIETIYFECEEEEVSSKTLMCYTGYCLEYDGQPICVYNLFSWNKEDKTAENTKLELDRTMQYIIASIEPYNGECFYELDPNFNLKNYYESGSRNNYDPNALRAERQFVISSKGGANYIELYTLDLSQTDWDGNYNTIFDVVEKHEEYLKKLEVLAFGVDGLLSEYEILKNTGICINGVDMQRYLIHNSWCGKDSYSVVFTFVVDGVPYMYQYCNQTEYDNAKEANEACRQMLIDAVELAADTEIRTMRFVDGEDNKWLDYLSQ